MKWRSALMCRRARQRTGRFVSANVAFAPMIVFLLSATATAQGTVAVRVPDDPTCAECSIRVQEIVRIQGRDQLTSPPALVRMDSKGRYWILPGQEPALVYDSVGNFLRRLGRKGNGPGEYWAPIDAVGLPGDSTLLVDLTGYAAVLNPEWAETRRVRMPAALRPSVVVNWPHEIVMAGSVQTPEAIGLDLHVLSFDKATARIVQSFALDNGEFRPGMSASYVLTRSADGVIWAANRGRYRVGLWRPNGVALRVLQREPSWFREESPSWAGNHTTPPPPYLSGLHVDNNQLVWALVAVPARTWREAWAGVQEGTREVSVRQLAWEKLYDVIVEVIDPIAGRVVAREKLSAYALGFLPNGRLATYRLDASGQVIIAISELSLNRVRGKP